MVFFMWFFFLLIRVWNLKVNLLICRVSGTFLAKQ